MNRLRPLVGWLLALAGAIALFLGWYGVSGTAIPAKQVPYLVSGGLTGVALIVVAAAAFATDDVRRQLQGLEAVERRVAELYALLTEEPAAVEPAGQVALPSGTTFHRVDCRLVRDRPDAVPVPALVVVERGLQPCRLCDPA